MKLTFLVVLLACLSSACRQGNESNNVQVAQAEPQTQSAITTESVWPQRAGSPILKPEIEAKVSAILARMSVEEKVGQIIQPEIRNITPQDIREYHIGAVLNGGGTTPGNNKYASVADWVDLAEQFYQASMDESDGRVGIPVLWGSDAVHGNNNLYGATLFPHNIGLGAANDPELIERIGEITALELAVTGLDWNFGPTVAVARDDRWGRTYESYSESPDIVAKYAKRFIKGVQGSARDGEYLPGKVIATAKHFVGDGGTRNGVDRGDTVVSEQELMSNHGGGYLAALDSHVLTTMASFNSWNGEKLHGHKYLLTDVLKEKLGFNGFIVGDWNGHQQVPGCSVSRCAKAINAGLDMFMVPQDWQALYRNTLDDVKNEIIPMARLNDAVRRILRVKFHAGLFEAGAIKQRKQISQSNVVGSAEHRAVARAAVRKSLVLLKNSNKILPINPQSKVLVSGLAADNISHQAGGWTLNWQGTGNTNNDFPGATSIYAGIEEVVSYYGGQAVLSTDGDWQANDFSDGAGPDVAIVVIGEKPYAEWHGDIANIEYQYDSKSDLALLKKLKQQNIPVVTVFISGRPLWVNKELNNSDAFVAAWLPGSEGAGIADVVVGNGTGVPRFDFQGRLSFSWPKRFSQTKLNYGQDNYDPLFAYGYGLSYAADLKNQPQVSNNLDESSVIHEQDPLGEQWVFVSRVNSPWVMELREQGSPVTIVDGKTASTQRKNIIVRSVDKVSQEDARQITWSNPGIVSFSTQTPLNLEPFKQADGLMEFEIKVNQVPGTSDTEFALGMKCAKGCSESVSLAQYAASESSQKWTKVSVPLRCFFNDGGMFNAVTEVFQIRSDGVADISIANVKLKQKQTIINGLRLQCNGSQL